MEARVDFQKYPQGCKTLENMIPLTQGGASRRPGLRYVAEVKDSNTKTRLFAFEFSTVQAYVLELNPTDIRFYKDQGRITVANTDAAIANGTFASGITDWDDRSTGAATISHDATNGRLNLDGASAAVAWAEQDVTTTNTNQEHVLRFRVVGAAGDKIQLRIGTTSTGNEIVDDVEFGVGWHAYAFTPTASPFYVQFRLDDTAKTVQIDDVSLIDNAPVEIGAPYKESELFQIQGAQSADVLYLVYQDQPPHKLTRSGHSSWSLTEVGFQDGPWLAKNLDTAKTLVASVGTGLGITITAAGHAPFKATDVGRLVRMKSGSDWGWAVVTGFTSSTVVTVDVKGTKSLPTVANSDWRLGAWSAETGYPCAVTFFEQRLWFAGSSHQPQTLWGSQSADFENMAPDDSADTVEADDALDITISADQVNGARWLSQVGQLLCGTVGGEWQIRSTTRDDPITPTNIQARRQSTHGSSTVRPLPIGNVVLFMQRQGRKLLELAFSFEADGFRAPDLTILADHVTRSGVVDIAYQQEPDSSVLCVRADGECACLTYKREQDVVGWARLVPGGTFGTGAARFETVAVIPGSGRDEAWFVVKRTIGGATKRYVEFIEAGFETGDTQADAFYVDSGLGYSGTATTTITGLAHLEGETVSVLADGAVHPARIVSGGQITLQAAATKVQAGLKYIHTMESLRLEAGAAIGTATGQTKRVSGVTLVLLDSMNARVGPATSTLDTVPFRSVGDQMDTAVPLFTGEKFIEFDGDYTTDARIVIRGDDPTPFTCLAMAPRLKTNEA